MQGFISLNRKIISHWIFKDDKKFKWWVIMLLEVNYTDNKFNLGGEIFDIKRGQSCISLRSWAKLLCTTPKTVQAFFRLLQKDGMITTKIIGKGKQSTTLVNIENYNSYQVDGKREVTRKVTHKVNANYLQLNKGNKDNKEIMYREFAHLSISNEQIDKLKEQNFTIDQIDHVLNKIQNFKKNTQYSDLYLTALNWLKDDKIKITPQQQPNKPLFIR